MRIVKNLGILAGRLMQQGLWVTTLWAADHFVRIVTGAPIRRVSQITPQLHVGGQYRRRGWSRLTKRGVTAVVNLRAEFDDPVLDSHLAPTPREQEHRPACDRAGVVPERYLYLPTADNEPPTLEHLRVGVNFIAEEIERGGGVYVHCGAGVGRAPTMAAAYLVSTGLKPEEAWAKIRAVRPFIRPKSRQVAQIERFAQLARE